MLNDPIHLNKPIAWNGIAFKIPESWEIDSLDNTHLIVSENGSPRAEIKWTESHQSFTLEKHLKKFISRSQKLLNIKIHEQPSPPFFSHSIPGFKFFFFSWESPSSKGDGTLIFCTHCQRLTLFRFFFDSCLILNSSLHLILSSFTDHPVTEQVPWQLFGMAFSTPMHFTLSDYSFKPGCFIIGFEYGKIHMTISSWGPASFLLSGKTPAEFAKERLPELNGFATAGTCDRGEYLEWSYRRGPFKNAGILPFFSLYSRFILFRICQDTENNRIYGVKIDSPKMFEIDLMKGSIIGGR